MRLAGIDLFLLAIIAAFLMPAGLTACAGNGEIKTAPALPEPPAWVRGDMEREGMICSVGTADPTFYIDDAQVTAAGNCRKDLALTISTQITSVMIDTATDRGNSFDEATVSQTTASISEMVVENAQVVEYWLDIHGQLTGKKNITFALCCMPRNIF
jgi:hypothetical protein